MFSLEHYIIKSIPKRMLFIILCSHQGSNITRSVPDSDIFVRLWLQNYLASASIPDTTVSQTVAVRAPTKTAHPEKVCAFLYGALTRDLSLHELFRLYDIFPYVKISTTSSIRPPVCYNANSCGWFEHK